MGKADPPSPPFGEGSPRFGGRPIMGATHSPGIAGSAHSPLIEGKLTTSPTPGLRLYPALKGEARRSFYHQGSRFKPSRYAAALVAK